MDKKLIQKAFGDAEKELQEKQIEQVKEIVKKTLQKRQEKLDARRKLDEEIAILTKDLDDMKAGRLDKIEERQEKDPKAREISVIIIKRIEREYVPYQPWVSPYVITWNSWYDTNVYPITTTINYKALDNRTAGTTYALNAQTTDSTVGYANGFISNSAAVFKAPGTLFSKFASGSYEVDGKVVNF